MPRAVESKKQRQARAQELFARGDKQQANGNLKSGFRLLLAAAKLGDSSAQLNLGYTYDVGLGVRRNRAAAMYWYEKAGGCAANNIGTIFRDEHDYPEAVRWFRRAVRYGDVGANLELARIYLKDPRRQDKAVTCLKDILKATPPIGISEDTQRDARKLLKQIKAKRTALKSRMHFSATGPYSSNRG